MTLKIQRAIARAKKLAKKGKINEAQNLYKETLKEQPQNEEVKKGLADLQNIKAHQEPPREQVQLIINHFSNGELNEATIKINDLSKEFPFSALLYNIGGAIYKSSGQLNTAVKKFEQSLALKPRYAEAHYNLGVTLNELGQIKAAIKSYKNAIEIKNEYPDAHNNLGNIYLDLHQFDDAVEHFEWAVAFNPEFAQGYNNLGIANKIRGQNLVAAMNFEKALTIKPDYAEAANYRGILFQDNRDYDSAIQYYQKALLINPNLVDAYNNMGLAQQEMNLAKKALKNFEKALAIDPNSANAFTNILSLKGSLNSKQIAKVKSILGMANVSQSDQIALNFVLAGAIEPRENQNEFFKYLHEGNNLRKKELGYTLESSKKLFTKIRKISDLTPTSIDKSFINDNSAIRPIFILGMPRSGTSLVEQIISSHKEVFGAGELNVLGFNFTKLLNEFNNSKGKNEISQKALVSIREKYLASLSTLHSSENIITDKAPSNFRFIGIIMSAFPNARIIHLKRDPVAICWSIYKRNWSGNGYGFSYSLEDLIGYYGLYSKLMNFWHKKFPGKIYDISYEKLTTNQEEETRSLLKYCGLEWDENCLNFHKNTRAVKTASSLQVREKMYQGSSDAWKKHEAHLQQLIEGLKPYQN